MSKLISFKSNRKILYNNILLGLYGQKNNRKFLRRLYDSATVKLFALCLRRAVILKASAPLSLTVLSATLLVHGWDRIKHIHFYSLLALSTPKNVKCYPAMTKT